MCDFGVYGINEPFSRALDLEEDLLDDDSALNIKEVTIDWKEAKYSCKHLIVAVGSISSEICSHYCIQRETDSIATIKSENIKDLKIYKTEGNIIVIIENDINEQSVPSFVKQIYNHITSEETIIFTDRPLAFFNGYNEDYSIIRCLSTGSNKQDGVFKSLEEPNLIDGLSAQVLTYCEMFEKSAILFVFYGDFNDDLYRDSIFDILKNKNVQLFKNKGTAFNLKNRNSNISNSNLYT